MRVLNALFIFACAFLGFACSSRQEVPAQTAVTENSYNLGDKQLLEILDAQSRMFDYLKRTPDITQGELKSKSLEVQYMWMDYLRKNPKNINALILFGKFLRTMHDTEGAYEIFKQADNMDPGIAVIKQQLATYEGENKEYAKSYANLLCATELEPQVAVYHYQLGELLFLAGDILVKEDVLTEGECEKKMLGAFEKASLASQNDRNFAIRHAQAFFDAKNPDWDAALKAWDRAARLSPLLHEKDFCLINKARILVNLRRPDEALAEIRKISRPEDDVECQALIIRANSLLEEINKEAANNKKAFTY